MRNNSGEDEGLEQYLGWWGNQGRTRAKEKGLRTERKGRRFVMGFSLEHSGGEMKPLFSMKLIIRLLDTKNS